MVTNVNRSWIWDPTTKQFPFEDCLYVRFLIDYSMLHCHFEISHLHLSWWWSVLASLKDTDLQWSYSVRDHWYTNHAQSSKSKQSNKNVSKKFKVKYVLTIHFLECSSQVCRVGKANKSKSLGFASPLISDNLDIVLQAHKIFSFKPYQKK